MNFSTRKIVKLTIIGCLLLFGLFTAGKWTEDVDAGEVVIIQDPVNGKLNVYKSPGLKWQGWGKVTHYKKSGQFEFLAPSRGREEKDPDLSLPVKWRDGGHSQISGSIRYDLPLDDISLTKLHSIFGSQEAIETHLIRTNMEKAVYLVGPLMTSKESYAEKKNDLIYYIEDQASRGAYKTKQIDVKELDPLSGQEKIVTRVEIENDASGNPRRQEISPIVGYRIKLYNMSINNMHYNKIVEDQIETQQKAIMQVQTAIAKAKEAEQRAITVEKEGEANAKEAKWVQEVEKAKLVTQAEQRKRIAELDVETAALYKQRQILEGEGESAKKRLVMQANGALEQKLDAFIQTQKVWADAFSKYGGQVVPTTVMGNTGPYSTNAAQMFMEMITIKTAKDLNLDLTKKE